MYTKHTRLDFEFYDFLERFLILLKKPVFSCNTFLFIPKLSHSNINKYQTCLENNIVKLVAYIVVYPFRILIRVVLAFWRNFIIKDNLQRIASILEVQKIDHLFISHVVKRYPDVQNDNYFGNLPCLLSQKNINVGLIYIQHHKINIESKNLHLLNTNLKFIEFSLLISKQVYGCLRICRYIFVHDFNYFFAHLYAIEHQFSKSTLASIIYSQKIIKLCQILGIANLHLTFEGNAFEFKITSDIKVSKTNVYLHQFAPITQGHLGLKRFLKQIDNDRTTILTTSDNITNQFKSMTNSSINIITSGSFKCPEFVHSGFFADQKCVLILPEGTLDQTLKFALLTEKLSLKFPDINFIFRLHPDLIERDKIVQVIENFCSSNLFISQKSLVEDFKRSKVSIFNSSATGVQGMYFGVIPIHVAEFDSNIEVMNPFYLLEGEFFKASTFSSVYIKLEFILSRTGDSSYFELYEHANQIFQPFNYDMLKIY
jgi:hypothetical protein